MTSQDSELPTPANAPAPTQTKFSSQAFMASASTSQLDNAAEGVGGRSRPTLDESWEKVLKQVARYDDDMVKNWRDDIDTLLVFAGLFSAVITAFIIESYQWLSEDPADTTVALLTQMVLIQLNATQTILLERKEFEPDTSSIRINCFWFLSLIFSLTSALFGLLCKQWVREHQRDTHTRTPGEALALRQLRRESFEKWGVSSFLSALPILLEVALLLFFVGVLDLLWNRHHIPFALMLSAGLYFATALLPTLTLPADQWWQMQRRKFDELTYQFICPYKSPQAWAVYRLSRVLIRPLFNFRSVRSFMRTRAKGLNDHIWNPCIDWSSVDHRAIRRFDEHPDPFSNSDPFNLNVYELRALEWVVTMLQDSPSMLPHLQNVLGTIPPSVAMSAICGEWNLIMWGDVSQADVMLRLKDRAAFRQSYSERERHYIMKAPSPTIRRPALHEQEGIRLSFCHHFWLAMARRADLIDDLDMLLRSIRWATLDLQRSTELRFVVPFPVVDILWTHEDSAVRKQSLSLLAFFEDAWRTHPSYNDHRHDRERLAFIVALSRHINRTDCSSVLLTSKRGQQFVGFIHNQIVCRDMHSPISSRETALRRTLMSEWIRATERVQQVGSLSPDYFAPIPGPQVLTPASACVQDSSGIRYSIDTVIPESTSEQCRALKVGNPAEDSHGQAERPCSQIDDVGGAV
ncbi:hypothetical protein WG66_006300 [Moniliophthora roreri]|uniref:DUF6535 domain-containing protein n=1 Tax=Moniliophthora roreri TaxID=221103 RepID=A0A0W0FK27_MONRR|nr:hypothetical protein WG66_006300 [Moniliophthora roreri]